MNEQPSTHAEIPAARGPIARDEFELFLQEFTHEIRNQLNIIALEAADMADQIGSPLIAGKLQKRVQDCSAYLKKVREMLAPHDPAAAPASLDIFMQQARERKGSR